MCGGKEGQSCFDVAATKMVCKDGQLHALATSPISYDSSKFIDVLRLLFACSVLGADAFVSARAARQNHRSTIHSYASKSWTHEGQGGV